MTLTADIQKYVPGAVIDLFELSLTPIGVNVVFYFHAGLDENSQPIVFDGITYQPWPVKVEGMGKRTRGTQPRPTLLISDYQGVLGALNAAHDDLIGAELTRRRTLEKYLDNGTAPNPSAAVVDRFYIDEKTLQQEGVVQYAMATVFDLEGVTLPRRRMYPNLCAWQYRGEECGYTGTTYFKADGTPTQNAEEDVCGKRLSDCKLRHAGPLNLAQHCDLAELGYNLNALQACILLRMRRYLPFGGFPMMRKT